jgi:hypothetical protein
MMEVGGELGELLVSTVHFAEQWRRGNAKEEEEEEEERGGGGGGEGEGEEQTTLRSCDVWLTVETTKANGELRELLGRSTVILLIFPLFLLFFLFSFLWPLFTKINTVFATQKSSLKLPFVIMRFKCKC